MSDVVIVALTAERFSAALRRAIRADRGSTVGTFGDGKLAARHTYVSIAIHVLDLADWAHQFQARAMQLFLTVPILQTTLERARVFSRIPQFQTSCASPVRPF